MEKDFQKDKKLNPYKEMKFNVYMRYLYIYQDLFNPSSPVMTFHVTAVFPAPYLCHVIDNQPVNRQ